MDAQQRQPQQYVLGSHAEELARLDAQARAIEMPTRMLLTAAGLSPGWRVLDLGTGLGHVARLVSQMVAPGGSVVGLERSSEVLAEARRRTEAGTRVSFAEGDVTSWRGDEPFDAIVGRLLLFHMADPAAVVRHHLGNLRPGGRFVAVDFDIGSSRAEPEVPLVRQCLDRVIQAFRAAGASPMVGARLGVLLSEGGLQDVKTFGIQPYLPPHDPAGPALLAGVVRSLAGAMAAHGIATREELGLDTLQQRLADEAMRAQAVILLPAVAGAWGSKK